MTVLIWEMWWTADVTQVKHLKVWIISFTETWCYTKLEMVWGRSLTCHMDDYWVAINNLRIQLCRTGIRPVITEMYWFKMENKSWSLVIFNPTSVQLGSNLKGYTSCSIVLTPSHIRSGGRGQYEQPEDLWKREACCGLVSDPTCCSLSSPLMCRAAGSLLPLCHRSCITLRFFSKWTIKLKKKSKLLQSLGLDFDQIRVKEFILKVPMVSIHFPFS